MLVLMKSAHKKILFCLGAISLVISPYLIGAVFIDYIVPPSTGPLQPGEGDANFYLGIMYALVVLGSIVAIAIIGLITSLIVRARHAQRRYLYGTLGFAIPAFLSNCLIIYMMMIYRSS